MDVELLPSYWLPLYAIIVFFDTLNNLYGKLCVGYNSSAISALAAPFSGTENEYFNIAHNIREV